MKNLNKEINDALKSSRYQIDYLKGVREELQDLLEDMEDFLTVEEARAQFMKIFNKK